MSRADLPVYTVPDLAGRSPVDIGASGRLVIALGDEDITIEAFVRPGRRGLCIRSGIRRLTVYPVASNVVEIAVEDGGGKP